MFQSELIDEKQLGVIDEATLLPEFLKTQSYFIRPIWSYSGDILLGIARSGQAVVFGSPAYIDENGELHQCDNFFAFSQVEPYNDSVETIVLISDVEKILIIDLKTCELLETVLDFSKPSTALTDIYKMSYCISNQTLLYSIKADKDYELIQRDMGSGVETSFGKGAYPSWSPDCSQFAYLTEEGMYITDLTTLKTNKVVPINKLIRNNDFEHTIVPMPQWSSDGSKLIYHSCKIDTKCSREDMYITIYDIKSGITNQLSINGTFPDWKIQNP